MQRLARRTVAVDLGDDRGSITAFWVILIPALLVCIGLTFDSGQVLAARRQALDQAQNAAIAGTGGIDQTAVRQGATQLDPSLVAAEVNGYLAQVGAVGSHVTGPGTVTVTVTETVPMRFLNIVGISQQTVSGTATARVVRGVEGADS